MTAPRFFTTAEMMARINQPKPVVAAPVPAIVMVPFKGVIGAHEKAAPPPAKGSEKPRLRRRVRAVRDIMNLASIRRDQSLEPLLAAVCKSRRVGPQLITSACQRQDVATTRQIVCWVGMMRCLSTLKQVGRTLSRDHSTVFHAVRKIGHLIEERGLAVPSDPVAAALYLNRELGGV